MFNLEHAISGWRRRAQREGLPPDVIEELESHLRAEIEQQMNAGADAQAAFAIAAQLLGDTAELRQEFTTTNPLVGLDTIRRMGATYFKAFAMVVVVLVVSSVVGVVVSLITAPFNLPFMGNLPAHFINGTFTFYFNLVIACILGLSLFKCADRLGIDVD